MERTAKERVKSDFLEKLNSFIMEFVFLCVAFAIYKEYFWIFLEFEIKYFLSFSLKTWILFHFISFREKEIKYFIQVL